jgi:hypothetical protein
VSSEIVLSLLVVKMLTHEDTQHLCLTKSYLPLAKRTFHH